MARARIRRPGEQGRDAFRLALRVGRSIAAHVQLSGSFQRSQASTRLSLAKAEMSCWTYSRKRSVCLGSIRALARDSAPTRNVHPGLGRAADVHLRKGIPAGIEQDEQHPDLVPVGEPEEAVDAPLEVKGALLPKLIVEEHAHV